MRQKLTLLLLAAWCVVLAGALSAGAQQAGPVGVFDFQKTLENSVEGKKAISQIQQKEQSITRELGAMDQQIQDMETKQNTQKLVLSFEAQQQLSLDLDKLRIKRRRLEEDYAKEYQRLQFTLVGKFKEGLMPIVAGVAKDRGFSLILEVGSAGVAYFDQTLDITAEVIKRFDASAKGR